VNHTDFNPGRWLDGFPVAHDPEEKTLGIVGMGGIGSVS
jgi:lactate dehydrogenase-like 2-hydroxyacid dehydrogenase